ncbi:YktB family protein [Paenibacillus sp. y28]|uniref:YktB family protein n=1 Tax=Paenibacillus sp. y28 TaxID=3129110 RepID=UPI00301AA28A
MTFIGFTRQDFETFHIEGLDPRMKAIQERIQPKFKSIGQALCDDLSLLAGSELHVHIAKHARRKTNAPKDTWMAFCHNKRGYKQHPHFQIGLFDDRLFLWFALIYELPNKQSIAQKFIDHADDMKDLIPSDYVLSFDHMKKDAVPAAELDQTRLAHELIRFRDVKKAELLVGRHIRFDDPLLLDGPELLRKAVETFETLMPLYKLSTVS